MEYNSQAVTAKVGSAWSLKIEQHEISSTEKCRDLVKTLWKKKLKQVKKKLEKSSEKDVSLP